VFLLSILGQVWIHRRRVFQKSLLVGLALVSAKHPSDQPVSYQVWLS
jgi:hypothetical protein